MFDDHAMPMAPFMEVLTSASSGATIGYRLPGGRHGPNVVVAAAPDLIEPLTERLAALPTLSWMRGALEIVNLDAVADGAWHPFRPIDATLSLPSHSAGEAAAKDGYRTILRLCMRLGMIDVQILSYNLPFLSASLPSNDG